MISMDIIRIEELWGSEIGYSYTLTERLRRVVYEIMSTVKLSVNKLFSSTVTTPKSYPHLRWRSLGDWGGV